MHEATAALLYFKNQNNYQDDLKQSKDETFKLPSKYLIRKEIKNIITRLYRKEPNQVQINTTILNEDDLLLSIAEALNLSATATQTNTSLEEQLEETLRACRTHFTRVSRFKRLDKCCQPVLSRRGHSQQLYYIATNIRCLCFFKITHNNFLISLSYTYFCFDYVHVNKIVNYLVI